MKTRTELVMNAIGWQGGTVHQLCKELGLDVVKFLKHEPEATHLGSDYSLGNVINTCSMKHRKEYSIPTWQGNYDFWVGAANSMALVNMGYCFDAK